MPMARVRLTIRRMMVGVAIMALILPPAIYVFRVWQNFKVYSEWASDTSPNRPSSYHVPYPAAGSWPYSP
jgi:hypothetical protein